MGSHYGLILTNVRYNLVDCRIRPIARVPGLLFMCGFRDDGCFVIGWKGKLWLLRPKLNRPGYRNNWPWSHVAGRISIDFCWAPSIAWDDPTNFGSYDPDEFVGRYVVYEKTRKRNFKTVHLGPLENVTHLLIWLQWWGKRMVKRQRVLAVCMGMHARLGEACLIGGLDDDIIQLVLVSYLR